MTAGSTCQCMAENRSQLYGCPHPECRSRDPAVTEIAAASWLASGHMICQFSVLSWSYTGCNFIVRGLNRSWPFDWLYWRDMLENFHRSVAAAYELQLLLSGFWQRQVLLSEYKAPMGPLVCLDGGICLTNRLYSVLEPARDSCIVTRMPQHGDEHVCLFFVFFSLILL